LISVSRCIVILLVSQILWSGIHHLPGPENILEQYAARFCCAYGPLPWLYEFCPTHWKNLSAFGIVFAGM
jgi:hypothetical protein